MSKYPSWQASIRQKQQEAQEAQELHRQRLKAFEKERQEQAKAELCDLFNRLGIPVPEDEATIETDNVNGQWMVFGGYHWKLTGKCTKYLTIKKEVLDALSDEELSEIYTGWNEYCDYKNEVFVKSKDIRYTTPDEIADMLDELDAKVAYAIECNPAELEKLKNVNRRSNFKEEYKFWTFTYKFSTDASSYAEELSSILEDGWLIQYENQILAESFIVWTYRFSRLRRGE